MGLIFFIISYFIIEKKYILEKITEESENSSMIDESMKDNMSNFMRIEINRRLAQVNKFL